MANDLNDLHAMRHSLAHILASAVKQRWPHTKFGVGPVVENGFYYDIDAGDYKISEDDFATLENHMKAIIKSNDTFEKSECSIDEAIIWAKANNQPYKQELLNDLKRSGTTVAKDLDADELGIETGNDSKVKNVSFYTNGDFTDLCRGPHVDSTGKVGAFKLMRVSGAYWRGNDKNSQMQRIYGVAFATKQELSEYLTMLAEAEKRDHRKLGSELELFIFSDLVGSGLPLWTPRGTVLRTELNNFVQELRDEYSFQEVAIPHITKKDLYEKSGHWAKFKDELFRIKTREGHDFALKPMSCPHHTQIFSARPRSYREMPIRYRETTMVYRDEQSGELGGLSRVRSITQDDAHVFARQSQIKIEVLQLWDIIERFYTTLGLELRLRISTHDTDKMKNYSGSLETWESSVAQLKNIAEEKIGKKYEIGVGEAAFYGPKLDFMASDAIGREHQVATIQFDFNQPESFDLACINEEGERERVVMIHCAVMGSLERFISIIIEHTAGRFPIWLAPEQIRIATLNQETDTVAFAEQVVSKAKVLGLRVELDNSNESVGKKIRTAEMMKIPYMVVIGNKEMETGKVVPRVRKDITVSDSHDAIGIDEFLNTVVNEVKSRVFNSSL